VNEDELKPILALDVGSLNIGVAISDREHLFAIPVTIIKRDGSEIKKIEEIIKLKDVGSIVVGLPKNLKGGIGPQAQKVLDFIKNFK